MPLFLTQLSAATGSYLSLSQTRHLHLRFDRTLAVKPRRPKLHLTRLKSLLALDTLVVSVEFNKRWLLTHLHISLFPHLNPRRVEYGFRLRPPTASYMVDIDTRPFPDQWSRIESVAYKGAVIVNQIKTTGRLRQIRLHDSTLPSEWTLFWQLESWSRSVPSPLAARTSVVFVVESAARKDTVEAHVLSKADAEQKKVYSVEVEEP